MITSSRAVLKLVQHNGRGLIAVMDEASERRNRLKGIRDAATAGHKSEATADDAAVPTIKFRNYKPRDGAVEHVKVEAAKAPALSVPSADAENLKTPEDIIEAYAPKKPHLDLKRDCAKRVAKLQRQTQRALRELAEELQAQADAES